MALKLLFLSNVVLYVDADKATALLEKRSKKTGNREVIVENPLESTQRYLESPVSSQFKL